MGFKDLFSKKKKKELTQPSGPPPGSFPKTSELDLDEMLERRLKETDTVIQQKKEQVDSAIEKIVQDENIPFEMKDGELKKWEEYRETILEYERTVEKVRKEREEDNPK